MVPMPKATRSVSPSMKRTSFGSMPSRSWRICLNVVSWPWPWFLVPMKIVALPLGLKRTSANSAGGEAREVGMLHRVVHALAELAAVIGQAQRRLVGHGRGGDDVLPAQRHRIQAELPGGVVDEPLDDIGGLGTAGPAIGRGGIGIAEHAGDVHEGGRDRIDAHQREDIGEGGQEVPVRGHIGPHIGQGAHAKAEEAAVAVQRQLGLAHVVARVLVGRNGLAALAGPLDRPAHAPGRPQYEAMLHVLPALGPEAAAHIARNDADLVLGDLEDIAGEGVPHAVGILHVGVERVAVLAGVVHAQRAARLQILRVHAGDDVAPADDVRRPRDGGVGGGLVPRGKNVGDIVGGLVPDPRAARRGRRRGVRHRRQGVIVHVHALGGVLGLGQRLRDHHRHRVADIAHAILAETLVRRGEHGGAVRPGALEHHLHGAEAVLGEIGAGENGDHARHRARGGRLDGPDPGMGMRRAHDDQVRLAGQVDVVVEAALTLQQPRIVEAPDPLPDPVLPHGATVSLFAGPDPRGGAQSARSPDPRHYTTCPDTPPGCSTRRAIRRASPTPPCGPPPAHRRGSRPPAPWSRSAPRAGWPPPRRGSRG